VGNLPITRRLKQELRAHAEMTFACVSCFANDLIVQFVRFASAEMEFSSAAYEMQQTVAGGYPANAMCQQDPSVDDMRPVSGDLSGSTDSLQQLERDRNAIYGYETSFNGWPVLR
jgi:hypothetical protein